MVKEFWCASQGSVAVDDGRVAGLWNTQKIERNKSAAASVKLNICTREGESTKPPNLLGRSLLVLDNLTDSE